MSKIEFNINSWRKKHVLNEAVGGVVSKRAFPAMPGMFRTEAIDHVDDEEAGMEYDELGDKDLDNDGDKDASDKYLHKRQGKVAKVTEDDIFEDDIFEDDIFEDDCVFEDEDGMHKMPDGTMMKDSEMHEELSDEEFNIQEWQKKFLDKRNLKWG